MKQLTAILLTAILIFSANLQIIQAKKSTVISKIKISKNSTNKATNRIIIKYKNKSKLSSLSKLYQNKQIIRGGLASLEIKKGRSINSVIKLLKKDNNVLYAEPDYPRKALVAPNDTYYSLQYGLDKIKGPSAWDIENGSSNTVTIAIVDTGVDINHPDLAAKIVTGVDIVNGDSVAQDDNGHGTHVAGIAAASSNNGVGVAGVAWNAKIMPIKVLDSDGSGYDSWVAGGITEAVDRGANIINMSLGGSGFSQTLQDATDYAYSRGVLVVSASGNSGDSSLNYPAANPNVIGVGATDNSDNIADFSTYNSTVDVSAPGVDIASTYWYGGQSVYAYSSGTSMATPFVAGLAALIKSKWPAYSPTEIASRLTDLSDDLGSFGRDNYYGYGRINAYNSLNANSSVTSISVKSTISAGQSVIMRGFIKPVTASRAVSLYQKRVGGGSWSIYKNTNTDSSGAFAVRVKPAKNTYYKIYAPAVDTLAASEKIVRVNVKPKVDFKLRRLSGNKVKLAGTTKPRKGVKYVVVKMVVAGKWRGVKKIGVKNGSFTSFLKLSPGLYRIKVVIPSSNSFTSANSKEKRVR